MRRNEFQLMMPFLLFAAACACRRTGLGMAFRIFAAFAGASVQGLGFGFSFHALAAIARCPQAGHVAPPFLPENQTRFGFRLDIGSG